MSCSRLPTSDQLWGGIPDRVVPRIGSLLETRDFSQRMLDALVGAASSALAQYPAGYGLIFVGSVARREAHSRSDVDSFIAGPGGLEDVSFAPLRVVIEDVVSSFSHDVPIKVAETGHFSACCDIEDLVRHVGGDEDTNSNLTRRMLVLLESVEAGARGECSLAKQRILDRYLLEIQADARNRPVFLLNDVVRFYRTMCVDYEHKRTEKGKNWGVRLVKLRHSRKLLYVSGLLPLLECMAMDDPDERVNWLSAMYGYTPLERLLYFILDRGRDDDWEVLERYADFLAFMMDDRRRALLDGLDFEQRRDRPEYVFMQANAWHFRERLHDFLMQDDRWREQIVRYVLS